MQRRERGCGESFAAPIERFHRLSFARVTTSTKTNQAQGGFRKDPEKIGLPTATYLRAKPVRSAPGTTAAPRMPGFQTADYAAGLMACIGILAALRRRDRYGLGAALDIAMFDSMFNLGLLGLASALARASGASGEPAMEIWGGNPRYDLYATRDGKTIAVSLLELRYWQKFCEVIGQRNSARLRECLVFAADKHRDPRDIRTQLAPGELVKSYLIAADRLVY